VEPSGHHRTPRLFGWKALVIFAAIFFCLPAWARSYRISNFNSVIHVDDDGSARIQEQITFVFSGSFQGIIATFLLIIPAPQAPTTAFLSK
jgi:hypothetical protein